MFLSSFSSQVRSRPTRAQLPLRVSLPLQSQPPPPQPRQPIAVIHLLLDQSLQSLRRTRQPRLARIVENLEDLRRVASVKDLVKLSDVSFSRVHLTWRDVRLALATSVSRPGVNEAAQSRDRGFVSFLIRLFVFDLFFRLLASFFPSRSFLRPTLSGCGFWAPKTRATIRLVFVDLVRFVLRMACGEWFLFVCPFDCFPMNCHALLPDDCRALSEMKWMPFIFCLFQALLWWGVVHLSFFSFFLS